MNDTDVDPLPSHVMALIEAERARPHVPETDQARALRRMETALAVGGAGAAGAGAAATAGAGGAAGAGVAGKAIAPSAGGLFARLTAGPIVGVLVAGAVGAGLGACERRPRRPCLRASCTSRGRRAVRSPPSLSPRANRPRSTPPHRALPSPLPQRSLRARSLRTKGSRRPSGFSLSRPAPRWAGAMRVER